MIKMIFEPYIDFESPELRDLCFHIKGEYSCTVRHYGLTSTKNVERLVFVRGTLLGKECVHKMLRHFEEFFADIYHGCFITNLQVWVEVRLNGLVLTKVSIFHAPEFDALSPKIAVVRQSDGEEV